MHFGLSLEPRLELRLALVCTVWRRERRDPVQQVTVLGTNTETQVPLAALAGPVCPCCQQPLTEGDFKDRNFRRRLSRFLKRRAATAAASP